VTGKERFVGVFEYNSVDKVPNYEAGVWGQTRERWEAEGLESDKLHWNWWKGESYFGMDERLFVPVNFGKGRPFERRILEESDDYQIYVDSNGVTRKGLKRGKSRYGTSASMDEFLDFPVRSREDFVDMKRRYELQLDKRYPPGWLDENVPAWSAADVPTILGNNCSTGGFYWIATRQQLLDGRLLLDREGVARDRGPVLRLVRHARAHLRDHGVHRGLHHRGRGAHSRKNGLRVRHDLRGHGDEVRAPPQQGLLQGVHLPPHEEAGRVPQVGRGALRHGRHRRELRAPDGCATSWSTPTGTPSP